MSTVPRWQIDAWKRWMSMVMAAQAEATAVKRDAELQTGER